MNLSFSTWLRTSNEAKPFRDALALNDKMPLDFGMRSKCFEVIQAATEKAWAKTKADLS